MCGPLDSIRRFSRLRTGEVSEHYTGVGCAVIVIQVTLGLGPLLSLGPTLPAILEPGAALIVLGAG